METLGITLIAICIVLYILGIYIWFYELNDQFDRDFDGIASQIVLFLLSPLLIISIISICYNKIKIYIKERKHNLN